MKNLMGIHLHFLNSLPGRNPIWLATMLPSVPVSKVSGQASQTFKEKPCYIYFSHVAKSWVTLRLRRGMGTDDLVAEALEGHGVCCLH